MKDTRSLLLLLVSAGLIVTWGYHIYDKSNYVNQVKEVLVVDSAAVAEAISDSLRKIYTRMLNDLGQEKLQIDSTNKNLEGELGQKLLEINRLQAEVGVILKRKNLTEADITEAKNKINELQSRIDELRSENSAIAAERTKLNNTLAKMNGEVNALEQSLEKESTQNKDLVKKINEVATFSATAIKLSAFAPGLDQQEIETAQQTKAEKFVGSFTVQNNVASIPNAEVMIVVTDPSGKIVNTEVWDVGSFETLNEGRKVYSRKIKFEYKKNETKRLTFTMEPEVFEKGVYKFSLYHNGVRIGETNCRLS